MDLFVDVPYYKYKQTPMLPCFAARLLCLVLVVYYCAIKLFFFFSTLLIYRFTRKNPSTFSVCLSSLFLNSYYYFFIGLWWERSRFILMVFRRHAKLPAESRWWCDVGFACRTDVSQKKKQFLRRRYIYAHTQRVYAQQRRVYHVYMLGVLSCFLYFYLPCFVLFGLRRPCRKSIAQTIHWNAQVKGNKITISHDKFIIIISGKCRRRGSSIFYIFSSCIYTYIII